MVSAPPLIPSSSPALPFPMLPLRLLPLLIPCASLLAQSEPQATTFGRNTDTGAFTLSWAGVIGRTYFVQNSLDLLAPWNYLPVIESGAGSPLSYALFFAEPLPPRLFLRLRHTDQAHDDDAYAADFDGDDIPSGWELEHGLDPFNANDATNTSDGLTYLEIYHQSLGAGADPLQANAARIVIYTP